MRYLFQISLSVLLLATIARAQTPEPSQRQKAEESWDNLRTLRQGEKIQVVDQKLKSLQGTLLSFSDEAITFQAGKDVVAVQRADVFRVSSRERGRSRGRNALIGLAVGAAVGAGLSGAMLASGGLDVSDSPAALLAQGTISFGALGAGIAAALPPGHPTIYRAERPKDQTAP